MVVEREWDEPAVLEKITAFCRSSKGVPVRSGIERLRNAHDTDRRVEYFRGEKLVTCLLGDAEMTPKQRKKRPFVAASTAEARDVAAAMLSAGFVHRAHRTGKGQLEWEPVQKWDPKEYYVWDYEGSKGFSNFLTGCLIGGMLVCTCFPIWPHFLKVYLWYCSVTFLLFMSVFCTVRILLFMNLWIWGWDAWILPNLFDESLSFTDSFKPGWSFEPGAKNQRSYRMALMVGSLAFFIWAYNQPTDFDAFMDAQEAFVGDLYSGKLLTDFSAQSKEDIDLVKRPTFQQLAEEMEKEAEEEEAREGIDEVHRKSAEREADPDYDPDAEAAEAEAMMDAMFADEDEE